MGTTWTRFRFLLDMSLLTIAAGRVFRISPPREGSKSTHQTSPRSIAPIRYDISDQTFGPLESIAFPLGIQRYLAVRVAKILVPSPDLPIAKPLGDALDVLWRQAIDGLLDFFQPAH